MESSLPPSRAGVREGEATSSLSLLSLPVTPPPVSGGTGESLECCKETACPKLGVLQIQKMGSKHVLKRKLDTEYKWLGALLFVGKAGARDSHSAPRPPETGSVG